MLRILIIVFAILYLLFVVFLPTSDQGSSEVTNRLVVGTVDDERAHANNDMTSGDTDSLPGVVSYRTSVRTSVSLVSEDDLAQAIAEAEAERAQYAEMIAADSNATMRLRMEEAEGAVNLLRARIDHLERALARANLDESTPFGHFALLDEAADIDGVTLQTVQSWLDLFPVFLLPHEAAWMIEWVGDKELRKQSAYGSEATLIMYLGADRLKAELSPERLAELLADYADEPWVISK